MPSTPGYAVRSIAAAVAVPVLALQPFSQALLGFQATRPRSSRAEEQFFRVFVAAADERTHHTVRYDPSYIQIPYPGGDVPATTGVCTDEVIRAYRAAGVDLQKEVHEDMLAHRTAYPRKWVTSRRVSAGGTDTNIDHRRVPNLMIFFSRHGTSLPLSADPRDYQPGDLVTWSLGGGITHIGIVVDRKSAATDRYLIVHNIGAGPRMEDVLFNWKMIGHYRYWKTAAGG
ncbi:MAG TPA: DUF1287 domain-containing protein [Candidatus Acidoferrum sp.]|nr:DUF1287 domain-containing protein [Candidatus Acidoferrum sp.]